MSALDIIELPGQPGKYARRAWVEAWVAAGSPPVNSAGRLYDVQKHFYDGWVNRLPGFNPADNPDDESQRLAHVRFVAGDIDPTPTRIRRLAAAGLIRPYGYEPWHWELPGVRNYAIVRSIPTTTGSTTTPPAESEEDDMQLIRWNNLHVFAIGPEAIYHVESPARLNNLLPLHGGKLYDVNNAALTDKLLENGIQWDAVDAVLRNSGTAGRYWSRLMAEGIAIRGAQSAAQKTLDDVLKTAAKTPSTQNSK